MAQCTAPRLLLILLILIGTGLLVALLMATRPSPPVKPSDETARVVDVEPLRLERLSPEVSLLGAVGSSRLTLMTSRINADVQETPVLAGTAVQAGQEILILDPTDALATLQQRQADVTELESLLAEETLRHKADQTALTLERNLVSLAEKSLARQRQLARSNVSSQERVEAAEIALEQQRLAFTSRELAVANHGNRLNQLQARLERARAQLTVAQQDHAQTRLTAPFEGWVTDVYPAVGSRVRPGDRLIQVLAKEGLEVVAQIPDPWVARVRVALDRGEPVLARTTVNAQPHELQLERLAARANERTGGLDAYFQPRGDTPLLLGKTVELQLQLPAIEPVYSAPVTALYGDATVYRIVDGRLQATTIERLGRYRDAQGAERLIFRAADLQPGEQIIRTQLPNAVSGLRVQPREENGA